MTVLLHFHFAKVRCIRSPRLFSNNFYLALKCFILVKNDTSKFFRNWLMSWGASGLPKFDPGAKLANNEIWP